MILARALRRDGRAADAARLLSALEPEARTKPALAEQFALALAESGDLAGAARAWDAARAANPADPYVRAETALAFHRAGDTARAAAELSALDAMKGGAAQRRRVAGLMRAKP
jgi:Flp pilus assembly protein TadD